MRITSKDQILQVEILQTELQPLQIVKYQRFYGEPLWKTFSF